MQFAMGLKSAIRSVCSTSGTKLARLAQQAEIAVCRGGYVFGRHARDAREGGVDGAPADDAVPGLDDLADEVDAARAGGA